MTQLPGGAVRTAQRPTPLVGVAEIIRDIDLNKYLFWADSFWTDSAGAPIATAPFFQLAPTFNARPQVGQAVTCSSGTLAGYPAPTPTFQWEVDGAPVNGATAASYTPVLADSLKALSCLVTISSSAGSASYRVGPSRVMASANAATVTPGSFPAGTAAGTVVATISGVPAGTGISLVDSDRRIALNADRTAIVAGGVPAQAGTLDVVIVVTPPDGRSPQRVGITLTVTPAGSGATVGALDFSDPANSGHIPGI